MSSNPEPPDELNADEVIRYTLNELMANLEAQRKRFGQQMKDPSNTALEMEYFRGIRVGLQEAISSIARIIKP